MLPTFPKVALSPVTAWVKPAIVAEKKTASAVFGQGFTARSVLRYPVLKQLRLSVQKLIADPYDCRKAVEYQPFIRSFNFETLFRESTGKSCLIVNGFIIVERAFTYKNS
ncbi:MAG TPA: hypothetical protein VLA84_14410 [Microcoleus sp.]|nr:hypothetical protein [Microcoleus sp.]